MYNFLSSNILYSSILYVLNCNFYQKLYDFLTVEWFGHVTNCMCILAFTTLKMATWVAETCRLLLCNKVTFIHPKVYVVLIKDIIVIRYWSLKWGFFFGGGGSGLLKMAQSSYSCCLQIVTFHIICPVTTHHYFVAIPNGRRWRQIFFSALFCCLWCVYRTFAWCIRPIVP